MSEVKLEYTRVEEIENIIDFSKKFYFDKQLEYTKTANVAKADLKFRLTQLKKLYWSIKDHEEQIIQALHDDFHRSKQESIAFELCKLLNDIIYLIDNLAKWSKPKRIREYSPAFVFGNIAVERISMGSVLIIAPFNFPILLALAPVAAAICGGNSVVLKPSEVTANCAKVLESVITSAGFPEGFAQVVQGEIPQTTALLESGKFDKILYTGSPAVGSIVAQTAAKSLTPCILELGGKSPVFFTENLSMGKLKTSLKRVFFSGFGNSGQICVAPDYMLVHESIYDKVVEQAKIVMKEFYPELTEETQYTHMVHERAYERTVKKLKETNGKVYSVVPIDSFNKESLIIPPTIISDVDWTDAVMQEENFAPIIPLLKYKNLDDALDQIIKNHDTPLVQYIFSSNQKEIAHILARIRSGDCIVSDTLLHCGIADAPFGGIGGSGYGNYGGKWSYEAFTNERIVFKQPYWLDSLFAARYPPYSDSKANFVKLATEKKPSFDRNGNDKYSWTQIFAPIIFGVIAYYIKKIVGY